MSTNILVVFSSGSQEVRRYEVESGKRLTIRLRCNFWLHGIWLKPTRVSSPVDHRRLAAAEHVNSGALYVLRNAERYSCKQFSVLKLGSHQTRTIHIFRTASISFSFDTWYLHKIHQKHVSKQDNIQPFQFYCVVICAENVHKCWYKRIQRGTIE